jgi:hypothetical protein
MPDHKSLHLISSFTLAKTTQATSIIAPPIYTPPAAAHSDHSVGSLPRGAPKTASLLKLPQVSQPAGHHSIPQVANQARHRQSTRYLTIDCVVNERHTQKGDTSQSDVLGSALPDANAED